MNILVESWNFAGKMFPRDILSNPVFCCLSCLSSLWTVTVTSSGLLYIYKPCCSLPSIFFILCRGHISVVQCFIPTLGLFPFAMCHLCYLCCTHITRPLNIQIFSFVLCLSSCYPYQPIYRVVFFNWSYPKISLDWSYPKLC